MMAPPMTVTEDTPPDMLAGSMDLTVLLPDGHSLKMSVERSTPMMDLLVQVATANKMSPAGFILKPLNDRGPLPYKPSTPIGALDAWTIHVVPKQLGLCPAIKKPLKLLNQPFEQTFRLQVHLPRNQLYVARVSPKTRLSDILLQVCSEKNLDPLKYSLRHPINLDQVLSLHYTLGDYKLQEVTLVCNKKRPVEVSSVDIMALQRETSNPAYRNTTCEGSVSSGSLEGRSLSPVPSDESSASPPPIPLPPSRPIRKRRPAPKPPTIIQKSVISEKPVNGEQPVTVISHSRNSSDSSGYHEASVLSESPQNNSVPENRKMASVTEAPLTVTLSQSLNDVSAIQPQPMLHQSTSSNSISSLSSATGSATGRKKKVAPPPPPVAKDGSIATMRSPSVSSTASSTTTLDGNEANVTVKSATLPPSTRLNTTIPPPSTASPPTSPVAVEPTITPRVAPPVPRPRSKLLSDSDDSTTSRVKPASPKKVPAPQPKPRKIVQTSSHFSESNENKNHEIEKENSPIEDAKQKKVFMNRVLPSSMINSHKACVDELAFKFDLNSMKSLNDQNAKEIESESIDLSQLEKCVSKNNAINYKKNIETKENEKDGAKENDEGVPADSRLSTTVVGTNTEPDAADLRLADEEIDRIFSNATENHTSPENEEDLPLMSLPSPVIGLELQTSPSNDQLDWEYRLPAPPTFRDDTKSPTVTEFGTVTIGNLSDVVCSRTAKEDCLNKTETKISDIEGSESKIKKGTDDNSVNFKQPNVVESGTNDSIDYPASRPLRREIRSNSATSIYETEGSKSSRSSIHSVEQDVINELSSTLNQRPNRINVNEVETKQSKDLSSRSTLDNFTITTYKDMKPVEVFEDDSIKSSVGEKRDKSKDDAVFRAPKPRFKEPNLSRTSSFSIENNPNGPVIKRSVSYVSLLAANMPRHSQPYRAHLQRHRSSVGQELDFWPRLRKTSSDVNIDKKDGAKENSPWQDTTELQSVQVLRNILSRSQANLSSSIEETEDIPSLQHRNIPKAEDNVFENNAISSSWGRSQSEEDSGKWNISHPKFEHSASLGEEPHKPTLSARGPPSINLSTWSERPKRQVSIKNDGEYISGFGKKPTAQDSSNSADRNEESKSFTKTVFSDNHPVKSEITLSVKNESYKLEGRSKSISDLSRIPIVRAVELKKPFVEQSFNQLRLKPVEIRDDIYSNKNIKVEDATKLNGEEERFIGVDSLARRFGVPQKRPVSEYFGTPKYRDLQNSIITSSINNNNPSIINIPNKTSNLYNENNESNSNSSRPHDKTDSTSQVKAQAKIRSGGFVETPSFTSTLKRTVSQPSHINSSAASEVTQSSYINASSGSKPSNIYSVSITSNQKIPSSNLYIKQSQALDRKFPVNLQPVVKGFRVPSDPNYSQTVPSTKDSSAFVSSNATHQGFSVNKISYNRTLSTPSVNILSTSVRESGKDSPISSVRLRSSSSSISQGVEVAASAPPPPPPMMPVLRPAGERKGVKLLPPPTTDPRDLLMESIRSFGKDSLKRVSIVTKTID